MRKWNRKVEQAVQTTWLYSPIEPHLFRILLSSSWGIVFVPWRQLFSQKEKEKKVSDATTGHHQAKALSAMPTGEWILVNNAKLCTAML